MKVSTVFVMFILGSFCDWEVCIVYYTRSEKESLGSLACRPCSMRSFMLLEPERILHMHRPCMWRQFSKAKAPVKMGFVSLWMTSSLPPLHIACYTRI